MRHTFWIKDSKQTIVIITAIILGIGLIVFLISDPKSPSQPAPLNRGITYETKTVIIGDKTKLTVEIADTPKRHIQGLSDRPNLDADRGMLFLFGNTAYHTFWMKDMNFPIDIIWIREGKIVGIEENVPPPDKETPLAQLPTYTPSEQVNMVLETNAGWSEKHGVKIGDSISYLVDFDLF